MNMKIKYKLQGKKIRVGTPFKKFSFLFIPCYKMVVTLEFNKYNTTITDSP